VGKRTDPVARFWSKVDTSGGDAACWPWVGRLDRRGYGRFEERHGQTVFAHRYAYTVSTGEIPAGLFIMHACDVPACVNPSHLRPGTHADNMADMACKGRASRIPRVQGDDHPKTKISEADVAEIRRRYRSVRGEVAALAAEFGVHRATIHAIATGRRR
jgi:hypothetical protein